MESMNVSGKMHFFRIIKNGYSRNDCADCAQNVPVKVKFFQKVTNTNKNAVKKYFKFKMLKIKPIWTFKR